VGMVDSFAKTSGSYSDVPEMRESRRLMLTEMENAIRETTVKIMEAGPLEDAALLDTLGLLAEAYDVVKNGSK